MLTLEQIKDKLKDRNLSEVSRRTDISYATIYAISNAVSLHGFNHGSVETLSDYLESN